MHRRQSLRLGFQRSAAGDALVNIDPDGIVGAESKEKAYCGYFPRLPRICKERGLDGHAFLQSRVADETCGDRRTLPRIFRRFFGRLDHLLPYLMPSKAFLDLHQACWLQVDVTPAALASLRFPVLP